MKTTLTTFLLLLTCTFAHALDIAPFFKGPKPVAVLMQSEIPWEGVMNAETPMVAMYNDGQVVYTKREKNKEPALLHTQLSTDTLTAMKKKMSAFGDYSKLKRYYNVSPATDQPSTEFYLTLDGKEFVTYVYGLDASRPNSPLYKTLPKAINDLYAYLTSLDFADARPWEPPYIEVLIWGDGNTLNEPIHWPPECKDWPGLDSESMRKTSKRDLYSFFLPGNQLPKLRDFLKRHNGTVEIGKKQWAVSLRYAFPSEPIWYKALRGTPRKTDNETGEPDFPVADNLPTVESQDLRTEIVIPITIQSRPIWVFILLWILVFVVWPIHRKAKMWFFLGSLLALALWQWVYLRFWSYHWAVITIVVAIYCGVAVVYTYRFRRNQNGLDTHVRSTKV